MRLGQITDLHFRQAVPGDTIQPRRESRRVHELLPRALERIAGQGVDLLAVTGDVLDVPLTWYTDFEVPYEDPPAEADARERVVADYRLLRRQLDESGVRYVVLPGNHDWAEPFWEVFGDTPAEVIVAGHRVVPFFDWEHEGHVPHRLGAERARFERCLSDEDARPQVHLQHYVVTPVLNERYPYTYADGHVMAKQTVDSGRVRLSVAGHYHKGTPMIRIGDTGFSVGEAFCEAPFAWRVYEVGEGTVEVEKYELG